MVFSECYTCNPSGLILFLHHVTITGPHQCTNTSMLYSVCYCNPTTLFKVQKACYECTGAQYSFKNKLNIPKNLYRPWAFSLCQLWRDKCVLLECNRKVLFLCPPCSDLSLIYSNSAWLPSEDFCGNCNHINRWSPWKSWAELQLKVWYYGCCHLVFFFNQKWHVELGRICIATDDCVMPSRHLVASCHSRRPGP